LETIPNITASINGLKIILFNNTLISAFSESSLVTSIGSNPKFIKIPATSKVNIFTAFDFATMLRYRGNATFPPSQVSKRNGEIFAYFPPLPTISFPTIYIIIHNASTNIICGTKLSEIFDSAST